MDLNKIYYFPDGSECNIMQLVRKEPEWAANTIQTYEQANALLLDEMKNKDINMKQLLKMNKRQADMIAELECVIENQRIKIAEHEAQVTEMVQWNNVRSSCVYYTDLPNHQCLAIYDFCTIDNCPLKGEKE